MREQTKQMKALLAEYNKLKKELFKGKMFVTPDPKEKRWKRYDQLQAFFYPTFRREDWVNPLTEMQKKGK
jgi:hypothetical protein